MMTVSLNGSLCLLVQFLEFLFQDFSVKLQYSLSCFELADFGELIFAIADQFHSASQLIPFLQGRNSLQDGKTPL